MIGVVLRRNGRTWTRAGPSARAAGRRACRDGPRARARRPVLASAVLACTNVGGSSESVVWMLAFWLARCWNTALLETTNAEIEESRLLSSVDRSWKLWITRRRFAWRWDSRLVILATSRAVGSKRLKVAESAAWLPFSPCAPPASRRRRYARVSPSSDARISSGLMSGSVFWIGTVEPLFSLPAVGDPGDSSMIMSLRPVFGRRSMLALR